MSIRSLRKLQYIILVMMSFVVGACGRPTADYVEVRGEALGTFVQLKCRAKVAEDDLVAMVQRVDSQAKSSMSIFNPQSLLSRVNRNETDSIDVHIAYNIELARRFSEYSDGAYDITIKPLTDALGFGRGVAEREPNVDSLLEFVGYRKIAIEDMRLRKEDPRTELDLNSIAKGYTVDLVAAELEAMGIEDYMVNIGGEVRTKGVNGSGRLWTVGIETPYDGNMTQDSLEKIIELDNEAVATSGNYRRYYVTDGGEKIAHTIDPLSGCSVVSDLLSATVVAPTCAEADAAATMFMAMGSGDATLTLARRLEQEAGWRYYFIYADGDGYRVECSEEYR